MVGWRMALWAVLCVAALLFLYLVRGILLPFVISFIIAALLEPSVKKLRLRGFSRGSAVLTILSGFFLIVFLAMAWLFPKVTGQVQNLTTYVEEVTTSLSRADKNANFFVRWNPAVQAENEGSVNQVDVLLYNNRATLQTLGLPTTKRAIVDQYIAPRREQIASIVRTALDSFFGILSSAVSQLLTLLLVPLLVWMMLMDMENFKRRTPRYIPPSIRVATMALINDIGQVFVKYLRGVTITVMLYMVGAMIVLSVLRVPYSLVLGAVFGVMYLIPYIGSMINLTTLILLVGFAGVTGPAFAPQMASPWTYAIIAAVIYLVYGLVFDQIVYPQLVGGSVGLSGVTSMFVIFCGGALFGLAGMIIAFPLAGSIKVIIDRLLRITSVSRESLDLPSVPLRHRSRATV